MIHSSYFSRPKLPRCRVVASLALSVAALACSSSPSAAPSDSFTEVYTTVIGPNCSTCHAAGGEAPFLVMSSQSAAYANLVGVKASGPECGATGDTRVVPGSAATSLLYEKVSMSTPPCGAQMPLNAPPLSTANQDLIAAWINAGAPND